MRYLIVSLALALAAGPVDPVVAQEVKAGNTVAGSGFLAGDYYGASGEATAGIWLGANVLVGGSNRTTALQPVSLGGQTGFNFAIGVAALQLGLPRQ